MIESGSVKIMRRRPDGGDMILAVRGANDLVGEMAAIDGTPRSASAVAMGHVDVHLIDAAAFEAFVKANSRVAWMLARTQLTTVVTRLGRRLLRAAFLTETPRDVTFVGLDIVGFGKRDSHEQARLRRRLFSAVKVIKHGLGISSPMTCSTAATASFSFCRVGLTRFASSTKPCRSWPAGSTTTSTWRFGSLTHGPSSCDYYDGETTRHR